MSEPAELQAGIERIWAAADENDLVDVLAQLLGGVSGVSAVRVRTNDRGQTIGARDAGSWQEADRSLFRRGQSVRETVAELTDRAGDTVGSAAVQGELAAESARSVELLARQAGLAVGSMRQATRLTRSSAQTAASRTDQRVLEATLRSAVDEAPIGIAICATDAARAGAHLQVNEALSRLTGYRSKQLLEMSTFDLIHPDDRAPIESAYRRVAGGRRIPFSHTVRYRTRDGGTTEVQVTTTPIFDDEGVPAHTVVHVQLASAEGVRERDAATGLLTSASLTDELGETLTRAQRHDTQTAVMLLDVRRFAVPGRSLDSTVAELGEALSGGLRPEDTLARYDDNTLAVVLEELSTENAMMVAERFETRLRGVEGLAPDAQATVGIAMIDPGGCSANAAVERASLALRRSRGQGGKPFVYGTGDAPQEGNRLVLWRRDE